MHCSTGYFGRDDSPGIVGHTAKWWRASWSFWETWQNLLTEDINGWICLFSSIFWWVTCLFALHQAQTLYMIFPAVFPATLWIPSVSLLEAPCPLQCSLQGTLCWEAALHTSFSNILSICISMSTSLQICFLSQVVPIFCLFFTILMSLSEAMGRHNATTAVNRLEPL